MSTNRCLIFQASNRTPRCVRFPSRVAEALENMKGQLQGVCWTLCVGFLVFSLMETVVDLHSWPENWHDVHWLVMIFFEYLYQEPCPFKSPGKLPTKKKLNQPSKHQNPRQQNPKHEFSYRNNIILYIGVLFNDWVLLSQHEINAIAIWSYSDITFRKSRVLDMVYMIPSVFFLWCSHCWQWSAKAAVSPVEVRETVTCCRGECGCGTV